uniref:Coiled-coil domain containing 73 n=1 Tax=Labrus bergylta TaxID=56723 RepID=A0A3Q3EDG5_9LABR
MDLCADSGTLSTHAAKGGPVLEEELSFSSNRSQTGSGNTILLQLLEFKTHLLEIVEELQIQRDAKTLFEDQISKLVLENQELEWEKASLQHQIETVTNQHTEALMNAQKQFQAKISNIEEEKGIFQISVELKDKEMINLKEAMKSLQMLKYNLEKKANEMEVMRSLQHTHQLLLSQTQTVSKVEMELQTYKQRYQDLKQEHELMQEKSKAMENKVAHLMESSISSKTSWDKEKAVFLDHIKSQHQDLQAVREAYDKIKQEHSKLLLKSTLLNGLKRRDGRQCQNYNSQHFPTLEERIDEPISESDLPALQNLASTKTKNRDSPEDTEAKLITTEAIGGQDVRNPTQQFKFKQHLNPLNSLTFLLTRNNLVGLCSPNGTACIISKEHLNVSTSVRGSNVGSDLNSSSSSFSEDGLQISKTVFCSVKDSSTALCLDNGSIDESLDSLSQDVSVEGKGTEQNQGWIDDMNKGKKDREESNREQHYSKKEVHREDVKGGRTDGLQRGIIITQRTGRVDRREDSQQSSEDAGDSKQPGTATRDRKEEERTNGAEETEKPKLHRPENQIDAQMTTYTTTEKSNPQQDLNIMDAETLLPACVTSDCSQKVSEKDVDSSYVTTGYEIHREQQSFSPNEHQCINHWPNDLIQEVQLFCHDEVKSFAQDALPPLR